MDEERAKLYQSIANYYADKPEGLNRETLAMHAGYTDDQAQEFNDTILNMNRVLSEKVGIRKGEVILDAGCGVGGSSIWLAKNIGAQVVGISIVPSQIELAKQYALEEGVSNLVDFSVADYTATEFPAEQFDVVWAIESVCYALDKNEFVCEAYRILKPGGRLVVADGFQNKPELSVQEQEMMQSWLSAWVVPFLATPEDFCSFLRNAGFQSIRFDDITKNVLPFSKWLYETVHQLYEMKKDKPTPRDLSSLRVSEDQLESLVRRMWVYGVMVGIKPSGDL